MVMYGRENNLGCIGILVTYFNATDFRLCSLVNFFKTATALIYKTGLAILGFYIVLFLPATRQ